MSDIVFQSTYDNIREFIKDKKVEDLMSLSTYIVGTGCTDRPPTEMEKEFIKEFFTHEAWAEHIQYLKGTQKEKYFIKIPPFDLETISKILFFETMKLAEKRMIDLNHKISRLKSDIEISRHERIILESELRLAILDSYDENDVFWKDDGWCNVAEVLENHNLISLEE